MGGNGGFGRWLLPAREGERKRARRPVIKLCQERTCVGVFFGSSGQSGT